MIYKNNFQKEVLRIFLFLLIAACYFTTKFGYLIGAFHLILFLYNPKKFGMSRILNRLLNTQKEFLKK